MILVDTHAVFWLATRPERLSAGATRAIRHADRADGLAMSSISLWELAVLIESGRLEIKGTTERFLDDLTARPKLAVLEITPEIAVLATRFPADFPKDPADRLIAGTARAYGMELVTKDDRLLKSPLVRAIW